MKLPKSLLFTAALLVANLNAGTSVNAHVTGDAWILPAQLQRFLVQHMVLAGRSFFDFTYEQLTVEPETNTLILSGLKFYPPINLEQDLECEISIDQIVVDGTYDLDVISIGLEMADARVPNTCFGPDAREVMTGAGYENVLVEIASIDIAYSLPDSSAEIVLRLAVRDAAVMSLDAELDYLWFTQPIVGIFDDPYLLGMVSHAEFTVEDIGLVRRIEPVVEEQTGSSESGISRMLRSTVLQMLAIDESQPLSEAEQAFAEKLSAGVSEFWENREPLVVTVNPVDHIFSDDIFLLSETDRLGFLRPEISNVPSALRSIVPPTEVAAALADSDNLDDATRMKIGTALLTGDGAPRSIEAGARILLLAATNGSGEAATILAKAYQSVGRNEDAYEMTLIAVASGDRSALVVADELEQRIPLVEIMTLQDEVSARWPGTADFEAAINAAAANGDARAIAGHARAVLAGRDSPRSFSTAYMLATLAAAAGDHSAAKLRDRLDRRFGGDVYWQSAANEASDEAMAFWIDGGMAGSTILAATAFAASWCPDSKTFAEFSFTLENGKTASICENADSSDLTYFYGALGKPPELEYRGPLRGTIEGISGYSHDLAGLGEYGFSGPRVDVDVSQEAVAAAAAAQDTRGFFLVMSIGCCGGEETAILFRTGGWEYAVRIGYSRNVNPDAASEIGAYFDWKLITLISPDGQNNTIR